VHDALFEREGGACEDHLGGARGVAPPRGEGLVVGGDVEDVGFEPGLLDVLAVGEGADPVPVAQAVGRELGLGVPERRKEGKRWCIKGLGGKGWPALDPSMTEPLQSLRARFVAMRNVEIDDEPINELGGFTVINRALRVNVGIIAQAHPSRIIVAMNFDEMRWVGMVKNIDNDKVTVHVKDNVELKAKLVTSMDSTELLYCPMRGGTFGMRHELECFRLVKTFFKRYAVRERLAGQREALRAMTNLRV
jgi:hypothetical protein